MANIFGTKWGSSELGTAGGLVTWSLANAGEDISRFGTDTKVSTTGDTFLSYDFETVIADAFAEWSKYGDIEFSQIEDQGGAAGVGTEADIRIFFGAIPGSTAGYAFYPSLWGSAIAGDILLDTLDAFNKNPTLFAQVVLHEIGHALGLGHEDANSIMTSRVPSTGGLQEDDIEGIQAIYGVQDGTDGGGSGGGGNGNGNTDSDQTLYGTTAGDQIDGGGGNDAIWSYRGDDTLNGNAGDDTFVSSLGDDVINGGDGNDSIGAGDGNDILNGDAGNDKLRGGNGNDVLNGGAGNDKMYGDAGQDEFTFEGMFGNDIVKDYNANDDILNFVGVETSDLSISAVRHGTLITVDTEEVEGTVLLQGIYDFDLNQIGTGGNGSGNNNNGEGQNLYGTTAGDVINGTGGDDSIWSYRGDDTLNGNEGDDTFVSSLGDDLINGGDGNDSIGAGDGNDILNGDAGNDKLRGGSGDDVLNGGAGDDKLDGGTGQDEFTFEGMFGNDIVKDYDATDDILNFVGADASDLSFDTVRHGTLITVDTEEVEGTVLLLRVYDFDSDMMFA